MSSNIYWARMKILASFSLSFTADISARDIDSGIDNGQVPLQDPKGSSWAYTPSGLLPPGPGRHACGAVFKYTWSAFVLPPIAHMQRESNSHNHFRPKTCSSSHKVTGNLTISCVILLMSNIFQRLWSKADTAIHLDGSPLNCWRDQSWVRSL